PSCGRLGHQARVLVVVDVGAVERDVVLIATGSEDFAARRVAGLKTEQFHNVARLQGQLTNLGFAERIAHAGVGSVDLRGFRGDVDSFAESAQGHFQLERGRSVDEEFDVDAGDGGEAGLLGDNVV